MDYNQDGLWSCRQDTQTHRRQEVPDCGQDVDLQKCVNQLNLSSSPNSNMTVFGMPLLPLLSSCRAVPWPNALVFLYYILSFLNLLAYLNIWSLCQTMSFMRTQSTALLFILVAIPQHSVWHSDYLQTVDGGRREKRRFKYQGMFLVNLVSTLLLSSPRPSEPMVQVTLKDILDLKMPEYLSGPNLLRVSDLVSIPISPYSLGYL